ncbi:GMC family oxidoreductase [Novosphingobium bradum]|uniref:GMC family oxidoreductase n=1 Tax=Novosphingobium bradum TaxID=1737444 RepID=A0ABV7IJ20_9SPHN
MLDQYDYIIIGAGSAGSVIANKLSADPARSVLLIESGPDDKDFLVAMPRGVGKINNIGSKFNWTYSALTGGNRPAERWFKGKGLGGSSSVNGMVYMRGSPRDYDRWEQAGCTGWGWKDVVATYKQLEDHELGASEFRGKGGPLKITVHPKGDPLCEAIIAAAGEMGVQRAEDINDPKMTVEGSIGYQPSTIWQGQRFSAAKAFLDPARDRPNLTIVVETTVLRIEFEGKRAVGVRLRDKDGERSVRAAREVVLSAGAIESPKLLQLSGIGPAELLRGHGIEVVRDAPEVGRNLREHRHFDVKFRVKSHSQNQNLQGWRMVRSVLQYVLAKKGPMTYGVHEIGGFVKTDPALPHADMQFNLISVTTTNFAKTGVVALEKEPGVTFLGYYTRPKSQGEIRIQSANPDDAPYINANHLETEGDRQKAVAVVRWMRQLASQPALRNWIVGETEPGPSVTSDEEVLNHAMELGGTCFHICGTARMGADEAAVVDTRLKVKGVEGLRVADTSVMPTIVSGNTNGPAMMVGLRAASFILEDAQA